MQWNVGTQGSACILMQRLRLRRSVDRRYPLLRLRLQLSLKTSSWRYASDRCPVLRYIRAKPEPFALVRTKYVWVKLLLIMHTELILLVPVQLITHDSGNQQDKQGLRRCHVPLFSMLRQARPNCLIAIWPYCVRGLTPWLAVAE